MSSIKMSTSVLLIVTINLFCTLQPSMQAHLNDDAEPNLKSQLVDTGCNGERECEQFLQGNIKHVECAERKCVCKDGDGKETACLPSNQIFSNEIGRSCHQKCVIEHSVCNNSSRCECKTNFTASEDNKHCLPVTSQLEEYCEIDLNCQRAEPFSVCMPTKLCECDLGFTRENGTCFSKLGKMDQQCGNHQSCSNITANSICVQSHCVCKKGFVASRHENKCLPTVTFGESCEDSKQCQYHSGIGGTCSGGRCMCKQGFSVLPTVNDKWSYMNATNNSSVMCVREIAFGIECATPVDCIQEHETHQKSSMVCKDNTCMCRKGYTLEQKVCKAEHAVGAAPQNGINSFYFVLLFATIFIRIHI